MRFNQVFFILLLGSAMSALLLPPAVGDHTHGKVDVLFLPVAALSRSIATTVSARWASTPPSPTNPNGKLKTAAEMQDEIVSLKWMLSNLSRQLEDMKKLNGEMRDLGRASDFSLPFRAFAADSGNRKSLGINGSSSSGLRVDMPVICAPYQLVGRLQNVTMAGARILILTDAKFPPIEGEFRRYEKDIGVTALKSLPSLKSLSFAVRPEDGVLHIQNLKMSEVKTAGVRVGDMACLADTAWPEVVQGVPIGEVTSINENPKNPLFADVIVKPQVDLMRLTNVMVVVGKKRSRE